MARNFLSRNVSSLSLQTGYIPLLAMLGKKKFEDRFRKGVEAIAVVRRGNFPSAKSP